MGKARPAWKTERALEAADAKKRTAKRKPAPEHSAKSPIPLPDEPFRGPFDRPK